MKETLLYIISQIVDSPDEVNVSEEDLDGIITFTVTVAKDDMGKVIGKEGKVIRSIRNVMKIKAMKQNKRINITLAEDSPESAA
ncbi:MAG: KH domain-containing protein [Candidatus Levybacteria bacterium]|nr:KH domain-containing protein [Candidatus Levybacteria bacterium]